MLPTIDDEVGARIAARRQELGLSQRQAAPEGYTPSYLSLVEANRRRPTWDALCAIATRLDDNPFRLADGTARHLVLA